MNKDKLNLFHANKQRCEQIWNLISVATGLANDLTDMDGNSLDHSIFKQLTQLDDQLHDAYKKNEKLNKG